jgi:hypothetical protein
VLKNALAALDRTLRGEKVRRLPPGLTLYASPALEPGAS